MSTNTAILIADLGYGDAGKGTTVDALARALPVHTVVRYNGGAQAAHNVVTPDGRQHTFAQFGSAAFLSGVRTHLSRFMLVHPLAMLAEERHLRSLGVQDAFERTTLECDALIITPYHQAANRLKEVARGAARHGSCGLGVGETMADSLIPDADVLVAGDLRQRDVVARKLRQIRARKLEQLSPLLEDLRDEPAAQTERQILEDADMIDLTVDVYAHFATRLVIVGPETLGQMLRQPGVTLFEGAQGVLLDEWWGFYPFNSWSTLTFRNADTLLGENDFAGEIIRLGLLRGYATRHGAGPFVSEDPHLTELLPDIHNVNNPWQQGFRVGYLDPVALRYALEVSGPVDGLVVTHLDRMAVIPDWQMVQAYRPAQPGQALPADFDLQNGLVRAIRRPLDPTNLEAQECLTRHLMAMTPVYAPLPQDLPAYLARIENELGAPVMMTSAGPTAVEKVISPNLMTPRPALQWAGDTKMVPIASQAPG